LIGNRSLCWKPHGGYEPWCFTDRGCLEYVQVHEVQSNGRFGLSELKLMPQSGCEEQAFACQEYKNTMSLMDNLKIPVPRSSGLDRACTDEEALELYRVYALALSETTKRLKENENDE
jgi:hypothetical protein